MSKFNWSNPPYKIKKDGTQSKVHDRSVYRTPGNEVELAYGTFTVLESEKVDKIWYVTLKDVNETFKIKQQQMGNKKLPKTRVIITDTQPVIAGLLPAPMELIDQLVQEANTRVKLYNNSILTNPNNFNNKGNLKRGIYTLDTWENDYQQYLSHITSYPNADTVLFIRKISFLENVLTTIDDWRSSTQVYRLLVNEYHPDRSNIDTQCFQAIQFIAH